MVKAFFGFKFDEKSDFIQVNSPHESSSTLQTHFGFIPRTLNANRCLKGVPWSISNADPLGIYVLSEVSIALSDILTEVRIVGGLQIEDGSESKYKIIAVLKDDATWSSVRDVKNLPEKRIE